MGARVIGPVRVHLLRVPIMLASRLLLASSDPIGRLLLRRRLGQSIERQCAFSGALAAAAGSTKPFAALVAF